MRIMILLGIFWLMQAAAQVAFSWGASTPGRWWIGFVVGNAVGATSVIVVMRLYAGNDKGLTCALAVGGAFVAAQLGLAMLSRQMPALGQWACIALIACGMMGYARCTRPGQPTSGPAADGQAASPRLAAAPERR